MKRLIKENVEGCLPVSLRTFDELGEGVKVLELFWVRFRNGGVRVNDFLKFSEPGFCVEERLKIDLSLFEG